MMEIEFLNIMMKDLTLMLSPISHIVSYVADDKQVFSLVSPFGRGGGPGFSLMVHEVVRTGPAPVSYWMSTG